ncbi:penicillin-binding protein 1C, partial [bacterium]|nr:penicillin-binding protein 1C [bacterium]MBU1916756.1 penicillin-binding protein 1C [bacterium]
MKHFGTILLTLTALTFLLLTTNILPTPKSLTNYYGAHSPKIMSREGVLLREPLSTKGGRRDWVSFEELPLEFISLLINTEDKRFWHHPGIDPFASARALWQFTQSGEVISGASTIPMQLARMILKGKRTLGSKVIEMSYALYLELSLSKKEILEYYVNLLPFSNELYGLKQATRVYFKKEPKELSLGEAAYLLAIIRAPSFHNPYKNSQQITTIQKSMLNKYAELVTTRSVHQALRETIVIYHRENEFQAPHFTDYVYKQLHHKNSKTSQVRTSLDKELNDYVAYIVDQKIALLKEKNVTQAGVLVIRNQTGEILAYLGSRDYWDDQYQGMNDAVQQKRQPGSSLKPFTYAQALEQGIAPSHILPDVSRAFTSQVGNYIPKNYDRRFHGPVLMRTALANSLNVPAVSLLQEIGVDALFDLLKKMNFSGLTNRPSYYGLGLTLGNVESNLIELVQAYSIFARKGLYCDVTPFYTGEDNVCHAQEDKPVITADTVFMVRDFLSDRQARQLAFGSSGPLNFDYPVMVKTGTSQNHRDNWTIAVTPEYTVGVWVGNFNGEHMQGVSGVSGAAPIAHTIVDFMYQRKPWAQWLDKSEKKKEAVCVLSGQKPGKYCPVTQEEFVDEHKPLSDCSVHVKGRDQRIYLKLGNLYRQWQQETMPWTIASTRQLAPQDVSPNHDNKTQTLHILSPRHNDVYKIDPFRPREAQYISLLLSQNEGVDAITLDGQAISYDQAQKIYLTP